MNSTPFNKTTIGASAIFTLGLVASPALVVRTNASQQSNLTLNAQASAAGDVFTIRSSAVTAGATRSSGGVFDSSSSAGQPGIGSMAGGEFTATGGIVATVSCGGCQLYGDVFPFQGNCQVNLDDILCVLNGFSSPGNCPGADLFPCGGNGFINLDDILQVLSSFSGDYACPHPCPI